MKFLRAVQFYGEREFDLPWLVIHVLVGKEFQMREPVLYNVAGNEIKSSSLN